MHTTDRESSSVVKFAATTIVVAGLWFASPILVPVALSILISFALTPLVTRLERWHFGRVGSVLAVMVLGVALAAGTVLLVAGQAADLASQMPSYRENLSKKFAVVRQFERKWASVTGELARVSQDPASAEKPDTAGAPPAAKPEPRDGFTLQESARKSIEFLATAAGVVVLVIFILLQRKDLHSRALRVAGGGRYGVTSQALKEASEKLSRYVLAELALNSLYGVVVTVALLTLGVPNAFIWGLLCCLLRFVPYIGPFIAAAMPIGMSLAVSSGWGLPLATISFFIVLELIVNNIIEPLVRGRTTGLSPLAILAAAAFWAWLWGPVGLILSTPLTVCLFVLGKHYPPLHFFHTLMGEAVDKSLAARLYPRLLASDHDAVWEAVSGELKRSGFAEALDVTLVPALEFVKRGRRSGELDVDECRRVIRDIEEVTEEAFEEAKEGAKARVLSPGDILCIPTRDEEDAACCRMLIRVLELEGIAARTDAVDSPKPALCCLVDVRTSSPRRLQNLTRSVVARFPDIAVISARLPASGVDDGHVPGSPLLHSAVTLEECREVVKRLLAPLKVAVAPPPGSDALVAAK